MQPSQIFERYQELQRYVNWSDADAARVRGAMHVMQPYFATLVDDFYDEIARHPEARKVITGGDAQIARLKQTLIAWLSELFSGNYDASYVARRWKVGYRHVEIGLDQVYTNAALSRLRRGMLAILNECQSMPGEALGAVRVSLNTLLDLDLAIIEDAYQAEYHRRQQQSERLATIGQVAGGIAHELRNPLNVVKTSVYYLVNSKNPSPEKVREHLARINRHVGLADEVISALNSFARLPVPNVEAVAFEPFLREVLEMVALPGGIEVALDVEPALPRLAADPPQLRIAVSNLIRNARDAMQDSGRLTIDALRSGEYVELRIADTGCGIAPEVLPRVMEPLFTTKARGIGLGLAIARAIIERHNGRITVTSEVDRGSVFRVLLPIAVVD
jgi:signal transduction histidine kinase